MVFDPQAAHSISTILQSQSDLAELLMLLIQKWRERQQQEQEQSQEDSAPEQGEEEEDPAAWLRDDDALEEFDRKLAELEEPVPVVQGEIVDSNLNTVIDVESVEESPLNFPNNPGSSELVEGTPIVNIPPGEASAVLDASSRPTFQLGSTEQLQESLERSDRDGDGLTDAEELRMGLNPDSIDTDGDGVTDLEELIKGTNPAVDTPPAQETARAVQVEVVQEEVETQPDEVPQQYQTIDIEAVEVLEQTSEYLVATTILKIMEERGSPVPLNERSDSDYPVTQACMTDGYLLAQRDLPGGGKRCYVVGRQDGLNQMVIDTDRQGDISVRSNSFSAKDMADLLQARANIEQSSLDSVYQESAQSQVDKLGGLASNGAHSVAICHRVLDKAKEMRRNKASVLTEEYKNSSYIFQRDSGTGRATIINRETNQPIVRETPYGIVANQDGIDRQNMLLYDRHLTQQEQEQEQGKGQESQDKPQQGNFHVKPDAPGRKGRGFRTPTVEVEVQLER